MKNLPLHQAIFLSNVTTYINMNNPKEIEKLRFISIKLIYVCQVQHIKNLRIHEKF